MIKRPLALATIVDETYTRERLSLAESRAQRLHACIIVFDLSKMAVNGVMRTPSTDTSNKTLTMLAGKLREHRAFLYGADDCVKHTHFVRRTIAQVAIAK